MDLIMPDPGTLIWTAATFLVLFGALSVFAWPKILAALREREERIASDIKAAEDAKHEASARLATLEERLEKARLEANAIIEEGKADAEKLKHEYLESQRNEAEAIRMRLSRELSLAKDKAVEEIRQEAVNMAFEMSRRIVGKALSPADHAELIDRFIAEYQRK